MRDGEATGASGADAADSDALLEVGDSDGAPDGGPDTGDPVGDFGAPCQGNVDCVSGWCVESPFGYVCTKECLDTCPDGYDCRSVLHTDGDVTFLCLPRLSKLCAPCLEDFQCVGGACLTIDRQERCATTCKAQDDCPAGYSCEHDPQERVPGSYCQPKSGSCDCTPPFAGAVRTCTQSNDLGSCFGVESCDPEVGWVGCNAREAQPETCNYIDDECDGDVDEDFKVDGIYASPLGCGSCTTVCAEVLANAAETTCAVAGDVARCEIVSCLPGYTRVSPFVCAPDIANICQPCASAGDCSGSGAACSELAEGRFCTRACLSDIDCSAGFTCDETAAGPQCVPASGSCTCDGDNPELARSCTRTYTPADPGAPVVTCRGLEPCTADGWGECAMPDELCDGIDNDCDGVVDGPFKSGEVYSALEHCGACDVSCLAFVRANAVPLCDTGGALPSCGYACVAPAVDVNRQSDDGCECLPQDGPDLAGDDLDSNCDGVDGEVDNAIFVSKEGDDANPGTRELPVATIQIGLARAKAEGKRDVYAATGVYSESIVLEDGVGLFGGYAPEFDEHDVARYETTLIGGAPDGEHPGTVNALSLGDADAARETVLDGFTVFGVNAGNTLGESSYAVFVSASGPRLRISKNQIFGGPGGNGAAGARGEDGADGVDGMSGKNAKNLAEDCTLADESPGGAGGARTCGTTDVSGGSGGRATCPVFERTPPSTAKGQPGLGQTPGAGGGFGWPLFICATFDTATTLGCDPYKYGCTTCYLPLASKAFHASAGTAGTSGLSGQGGAGGSSLGVTSSGRWVGDSGSHGADGMSGAGGGGGGSGGGVEVEGELCPVVSNDDVGGSGGGGGAGGCFGTGGAGGASGGGSFGIFITGSMGTHKPVIRANTIQSGRGGQGGVGGAGGVGGTGGRGAQGGLAGDSLVSATAKQLTRCAAGGGAGGDGGHGGHGGGGGGGAGGPSYGIFAGIPGTIPPTWESDNTFLPGGVGGEGGAGGVSLDQARAGANGTRGITADTNF